MNKPLHGSLSISTEFNFANRPRYVESKPVDWTIVEQILKLSAEANHWTNFGPVSQLLEAELTRLLGLPDHLHAIVCSNATVALHTLVAMHQHLQQKEIRWVASAFGFYSSCDGILQKAQIVDCNSYGMLDLDSLDPHQFDGMVVTNMFGQYQELTDYQAYAKANNKVLLIDAAMALHHGQHVANECISLHHTKPWGFGEGGCAIVDKEHSSLFRDLLAFGHAVPDAPINRLASNGKISDVACAYILMRLKSIGEIRECYRKQFERITAIGTGLGLRLLGPSASHPGVPSNVPLMFPRPVVLPHEPKVPARKYYFPLTATPIATSIYHRIVNVACHSDMAQFTDGAIEDFLHQLMIQK